MCVGGWGWIGPRHTARFTVRTRLVDAARPMLPLGRHAVVLCVRIEQKALRKNDSIIVNEQRHTISHITHNQTKITNAKS